MREKQILGPLKTPLGHLKVKLPIFFKFRNIKNIKQNNFHPENTDTFAYFRWS